MRFNFQFLLVAAFVLGCAQSDTDEGDPLESADYEEQVLSQLPAGDSKLDIGGSGAAASLGLPDESSCPEEEHTPEGDPAPEGEGDPAPEGEGDPAPEGEGDPAPEGDPVPEGEGDPAPEGEVDGGEADPSSEPGTDEAPEPTDPCAEAVAETPWAQVYDLELAHVRLPDDLRAPDQYPRPSVDNFRLGGTEFWQKWSGGENPTFSYSKGSDFGRRCMVAAALRFQLIMVDPPESILEVKANTNWGGSFFNWVDDYGGPNPWGSASSPRLWAWRTGLVKWISQAAADGTCYLPTLSMVESLAADCLATAAANDGEIQGCRN